MIFFLFMIVGVCFGLAVIAAAGDEAGLSIVLALIGLIFVCAGLFVQQERNTKAQAVDAGHAEFYIDHDTHKREWRWLPRCAEEVKDGQ